MRVRLLTLLVLALCLGGCTYRAQVRRGIYRGPENALKINASVLVISDENIPQELFIGDTENNGLQSFLLETKDGVTAAVTDALGTLFATAEAGSANLRAGYPFWADVTVKSGLTRTPCEWETPAWAARNEGLCTVLTVVIRRTDGENIAQAQASRWQEFRTPGLAAAVRWLNKYTLIFSPVLTPIYMQSKGHALRKQFEDNLTEALQDITAQLAQQRTAFESGLQNKMPETAQNYVE